MKLLKTEIFFASPGPGKAARAHSVYTRQTGVDKIVLRSYMTRPDTKDWFGRSFSTDNGRTWIDSRTETLIKKKDEGVERNNLEPGFVDIVRDRYVEFSVYGILPTDDPLEGMKQWHLRYQVSSDGAHTFDYCAQMIQDGEFDAEHPFEGVFVGKNAMMLGDRTCRPIRASTGKIVLPVQITPTGPNGEYYNPGGGYTYHYSAFVIGTWRDDDTLAWELSDPIENDPARSTRGAVEPTVVELDDGRFLSIMRGSNDSRPDIPGYRWYSISEDGAYTWSPIEAWGYSDGDPFYSPSSCSQLFRHSNGTIYWVGNIVPMNPNG